MSLPLSNVDFARITIVIFICGLLVTGSYLVLQPFLGPLIWATMIVIATWPLKTKLQEQLGNRRGMTVLIMTVILLLLLIGPLWLAISAIIENADTIKDWFTSLKGSKLPALPEWVNGVPLVGKRIASVWYQITHADNDLIFAKISPYLSKTLNWFIGKVGGLGMLFIHFLVTVLLSAILYMNGEVAAQAVLRFSRRLSVDRGEEAARLAANAVRAVALGIVVTALTQSLVAGICLMLAGIPYALLLTAGIFLFGIIQVGPMPVMLPTVIWLFWSDQFALGIFFVVVTVLVCIIDNFLRPILIRKGANLPLLLVFAGVIGGMLAFGIIGLFIGPVLLAVTYTLLTAWVIEGERAQAVS